jgi:peptidoglycan/LPS O-acetylase OafA/YrhL
MEQVGTLPPDLTPVHSVPKPTGRIVALDGLRGVAALMVLLHHAMLMLPDFANDEWGIPGARAHGVVEWLLLRTPFRLAWSGQTRALLFFVLSGFVLSLPWLNGRSAPYGRFLLGRFCRIYPPYLIAMIIAAAGSILLGGHPLAHATVYFNELGWAFHPSWAAVPSVAAIIDNSSSSYMDEAVWTLVWEVRVALIFPLLMWPIVRWGNAGVGLVLVALILLKHIGARLVAPWLSDVLHAPEDTFYYAQYFVYGTAVAANRGKIAAWFSGRSNSFGATCLLLGCLICWLPWPLQHDRIVGIGAAVVIVAIVGSSRVQSWFTVSPLLWLGRQSYSLYLMHLPLIMVVFIVFDGAVPVLAVAAVIPAAMVLAWAFHIWVELPSVAIAQHLTGYTGQIARRARATPIGPIDLGMRSAGPGALARSTAHE